MKVVAVAGYGKERGICVACGAQIVITAQRFLGVESRSSNVVLAGFRDVVCTHKVLTLGAQVRLVSVFPTKIVWREDGLSPDSDFFSNAPALKGVLSGIANTNQEESATLLAGLAIASANKKTELLDALPALRSNEPNLLKNQLEAVTFREMIGSATNGVSFW